MRPLLVLATAFAIVASLVVQPAGAQETECPPSQTPRYVHGFAALKAYVGEAMGEPVTCEFPDPNGTGDVHQRTTTGLAFWRKSTNTPTFTNGWDHWALTADGLVHWTGSSIDPPGTVFPPQVHLPAAVQAALVDAAHRTGRDPATIQLLRAYPVEWPDGSLGCPQPGRMYVQVITPGWRVELAAGSRVLTYHTDQDGTRVVLCLAPAPRWESTPAAE